jgi:hypothetical protein
VLPPGTPPALEPALPPALGPLPADPTGLVPPLLTSPDPAAPATGPPLAPEVGPGATSSFVEPQPPTNAQLTKMPSNGKRFQFEFGLSIRRSVMDVSHSSNRNRGKQAESTLFDHF